MITFVVLGYDYMGYDYIRSLGLHQDGGETGGGGRGDQGRGSPYPQNIKDCKEVIISYCTHTIQHLHCSSKVCIPAALLQVSAVL